MKKTVIFNVLIFIIPVLFFIGCGSVNEPQTYSPTTSVSDVISLAPLADYKTYYDTAMTQAGLVWPDVTPAVQAQDTYTTISASKYGLFYKTTGFIYSTTKGIYMPGSYIGNARGYESLVGNLFVDAMFYGARTIDSRVQFFYGNLGGIRDDKATAGNYLSNSDPFKNYIVPGAELSAGVQTGLFFYANYLEVLKIKGENLLDMFEHGAAAWTNKTTIGSRGKFTQIAGAKVELDRSKVSYPSTGYEKVRKIYITTNNDTAVWAIDYSDASDTTKWTKIYDKDLGGWMAGYSNTTEFYMATSNYVANAGDDYTMLYYAKQYQGGFIKTDPRTQGQWFGEYISAYKSVRGANATFMPTMQQRIKFVD
ncbi:5'-nucleotidase C-terminal domain-containing protein [Candidatus Dependentiae bacterium]|nr:5'-nucleotidase C-terminal domain-containing protein [Candidatus Dependentiae bacterium]